MTTKIESLTKAVNDAEFLRESLRAALAVASPVEAIVLLPMIETAANLMYRVNEMLGAVRTESK